MPYKPSRDLSERDLQQIVAHDDSDDEDYDDAERPSRSRPQNKRKRGASALPRKKQRRGGYRGSDVSDDDDDEVSEEEEWTQSSDEEIETNEKGRPVRRVVKNTITYEESDEETPDTSPSDQDSSTPKTRRRKIPRPVHTSPDRKVVVLKVTTPLQIDTTQRSLRSRQPSVPRPAATSVAASSTRRSRRTPRVEDDDDDDDLVELSTSGRHVLRSGSREPEVTLRPARGGKSLAQPLRPIVESRWEHYRNADGEIEIPSSQPDDNETSDHGNDEEEEPNAQESTENMPKLLSALIESRRMSQDSQSEDPLQYSPDRTLSQEIARPEIEALSDLEAEAGREGLAEDEADEADDDEDPITARSRPSRAAGKRKADSPPADEPVAGRRRLRARNAPTSEIQSTRRKGVDETSDFDPEGDGEEAEEMSDSASSTRSPQKDHDDDSSNDNRRSSRLRKKANSRQPSGSEDEELELAEELAELRPSNSRNRRRSQQEQLMAETRGRRNASRKNYDLLRSLPQIEEDDEPAIPAEPTRSRKTGGAWQHRSLLSTSGPFGGTAGLSLLGGSGRPADADSDSSDDEIMKQPKQFGAPGGMTPTTAMNPFNPFSAQPVGADPNAGLSGTPANLGRVKDKQALADADPLGVDQNVDFDSVGGLQGHIDQLKEMVALPLLYPEIYMRFKITPPRGVLFHGPPGTGKTLLARALATSVSSQGRKVTFYMRKGADALSKWVGEAERQLRLLFEEARKTQPSIIFFDEIDGLAPVRSSKQEQIHASIVSTLLALMDGMDGRGQVIVIGATNRPDSIDPALRRPGRFDREFYFPLPDTTARRAILDIHTKAWDPPLEPAIKDELAGLTKGYGGADLRALCTEAALNAVQRRYPQIYRSREKLIIDPTSITVTPKDFMISIKKMIPSSERSASSGAAPLPTTVAPLLEPILRDLQARIKEILPTKQKTTALDEAQYEDAADATDFGRERTQQAFENSRVFRPRLFLHGKAGMGQQYLVAAILHHLQGVHVQSFDLSVLLGDATSSPESTMVRLFAEAKMHKPSVIFIPDVQSWFAVLNDAQRMTFLGLLRSIKSSDPILLLAYSEEATLDIHMAQELFGHSTHNRYALALPSHGQRYDFFSPLGEYVSKSPEDWPDPVKRKKRELEVLLPAPPDRPKTPPPPTKEELKAQRKRDRQTLNMLKIRLQPIMDQIRMRHKKFRTGVIEESVIRYLYDEADPGTVTSKDAEFPVARATFRPYEVDQDSHGVQGLRDQANGKFFYNLDTVTIEKRLSNGYYKRPRDFLADIKRLAKDAKAIDDEDRLLKANELLANVEVDVATIELNEPALAAECERVYQRELERDRQAKAKAQQTQDLIMVDAPSSSASFNAQDPNAVSQDELGQIQLGMSFDNPKDALASVPTLMLFETSSESAMFTDEGDEYDEYDDEVGGEYDEGYIEEYFDEAAVDYDEEMGGEYDDEDHSHYNQEQEDEDAEEHVDDDDGYDDEFRGFGTDLEDELLGEPDDHADQYDKEADVEDQEVEIEDAGNDLEPEQENTAKSPERDGLSDYDSESYLELEWEENEEPPEDWVTTYSYGGPYSFQDAPPSSASTTSSVDGDYSQQRMPYTMHLPSNMPNLLAYGFMVLPEVAFSVSSGSSHSNSNSGPELLEPLQELDEELHPPEEPLLDEGPMDLEPLEPRETGGTDNIEGEIDIFVFSEGSQGGSQELPATQSTKDSSGSDGDSDSYHPSQDNRSTLSIDEEEALHRRARDLTDRVFAPPFSSQSPEISPTSSQNNLIVPPEDDVIQTIAEITAQTSGLTVEQLEQVNSALMDTLWQTRGLWDRREVLYRVTEVFDHTLDDIRKSGQSVEETSWQDQHEENNENSLD